MTDDLSEIRERLAFCHSQASELRLEIRTFFDTNLEQRIVHMPDSIHVQIRLEKPIPTSIRSRAGLIVHEARSCLDGLACVLAIRNGQTTAGTYFPISKSQEIFETDGHKKMKKLAQEDQENIAALKPYGGGDNLLFGMHEFDRNRKHIRLNAASGGAGHMAVNTTGSFHFIEGLPIKALSHEWQSAARFSLESQFTATCRGSVTIEEPEQLRNRPLQEILEVLLSKTSNIVESFAQPAP